MNERLPNITASTDATLFRGEAERARRYAAAMTEKKVIDRLNAHGLARPWTNRSQLSRAPSRCYLALPLRGTVCLKRSGPVSPGSDIAAAYRNGERRLIPNGSDTLADRR